MKAPLFKLAAAVALILASAAGARAQALTIRTMAGGATTGATNGFGSNARFSHPNGVAADDAGNIYVADTENSTIRMISANGYASTLAGLAGSYGSADGSLANARFYGPQGIAADGAGNLYLADTANSTIRKVSSAGSVSTLAGMPGVFNSFDGTGANAQFYHPEAVAADAGGNLYVADTWNHTIRKITPDGVVTTLAGLAGYFGSVDGTNSKARFYRPAGIAVDSATNLYVADSLNHTLRKITPGGNVTTIAGLSGVWGSVDGTNSNARFYLPEGIDISPNGDLLVADSGNQTLRKVSLVGTNWVVSTVAGLSGLAGSTNGTGSGAQFYFPAGLGLDGAGNLYVADAANNLIRTTRVVPPTLQFTTLGSQVVLSWPVSAEGFGLQASAAVDGSAGWVPVTSGIYALGDNYVRTNSLAGPAYYRLHFP
jgi:sugar lactone lactonase YvrE